MISRLDDLEPASILEMSSDELAGRVKMTKHARRTFDEIKQAFDPPTIEQLLREKEITALTPADNDYPDRLREIPDPPPMLFVDGDIPDVPSIAIVGSRKSTVTGVETARELGRGLGRRGVCVVSGLALGIDAAAHEGALETGGPTVGVLGCGIDVIYPKNNHTLFERVRGSGAVVSEYYLGEPPLAWRFPARNRIIAGLADAVVVIEAPEKSGALITARHALESGRDVWAVPGPMLAPECRGSNRLLSDGAQVLWDPVEFLDAVAPGAPRLGTRIPAGNVPVPAELPEREATVLAGVGFEPEGTDIIEARSGVEMRELLPALALLELKGYVGRGAGGSYVRRSIS